jgi:hypothetical protein
MFANPYILLAMLALALGSFGGGVSVGYKWEKNAHLAAVAAAQNAAIEAANREAAAEKLRALAAAKAEADARLAATTIRLKGQLDAARKANPLCNRDADSLGLLNESIAAANGDAPAASPVPDPVRPDAKTFDWFRSGRETMGISGGGGIRPMPTPSR